MQFQMFQSDSTVDFQYNLCDKCELYKGSDYKHLASLAHLLLSISPTSVLCERSFSNIDYVKNEFWPQENLNACMALITL
jgi:hypothetical protein